MRSSPDRIRARRAVNALAERARDALGTPTASQLDAGLEALWTRETSPRRHRGARLRWPLLGAVVAASIGAIFVTGWPGRTLRSWRSSPRLEYQVEGGTVVEGGYLRDAGGKGLKLTFTGGTEIKLAAGTRGRLRSVDSTGARIGIEHGSASFDVTPHPGRSWLVDVGPFLVTVKGTQFTVSWDVTSERFELRLDRGRVSVAGPMASGEIPLEAGHRLVVDLPRGETVISELEKAGTAPREASSTPVPPGASEPTTHQPAARAAAVPHRRADRGAGGAPSSYGVGKERPRDWTRALAAGHFDQILDEADRAGIKVIETASIDDLLALADAARYRRRTSLARDALLSARRRFPSSARTVDADYLLGRVEEETEHGTSAALRFYDQYLVRAPRGTYAAEALGRRMILTKNLNGPAAAAPVAEEYLRRFPNGSYAGSARALGHAAP
jgi:FecR-like protein